MSDEPASRWRGIGLALALIGLAWTVLGLAVAWTQHQDAQEATATAPR